MTLLTVVQDVCAFVGVARPTSVFAGLNSDRTKQELLACANEAAQVIAYDEREWGVLQKLAVFDSTMSIPPGPMIPPETQQTFPLPADFKRPLLTTNVRRQSTPTLQMRFINDTDEWVHRRTANYNNSYGEWILTGTSSISVSPPISATDAVFFPYLSKNCINVSGGVGSEFLEDFDSFILDERLLKLCMIWRWKHSKGSPYAEDMSNFEIALSRVAGADQPSPIIAGRLPVSSSVRVAMPWPSDWGSTTL